VCGWHWDRQVKALRGDYKVAAFDIPGHGRSPGGPKECTFGKTVCKIAHLVETEIKRPVTLSEYPMAE
jgi:pimeloyl-ACP methyl ester carboxylesterase